MTVTCSVSLSRAVDWWLTISWSISSLLVLSLLSFARILIKSFAAGLGSVSPMVPSILCLGSIH